MHATGAHIHHDAQAETDVQRAIYKLTGNTTYNWKAQLHELLRVAYLTLMERVCSRGGFKDWPLVKWPTRPLPYGPQRPLMKIDEKCALQLPKQDFYSFKLCTVDNVHAVRPVDNNAFSKPEVRLTECLGGPQ